MKQKKINWILYILILAIVGGIFYIATKDISPISHEIEKAIQINYRK